MRTAKKKLSLFTKRARALIRRLRHAGRALYFRYRMIAYAGAVLVVVILGWETYLHLKFRTVILVDGQRFTVKSRPQTVQKLLAEQKILIGEKDIIDPRPSAAVPRGGAIRIIRVSEQIKSEDEILPFKIISRKTLTENLRKVEFQKGLYRKVVREIHIVRHDGVEVERAILKEREIRNVRYRLALLKNDDTIEAVYDLSRCKKIRMVATAYYPGDPLCWKDGTITCLGLKMQRGIVAVDPRVIPLRTRVYVPGYGYGFAADTGSAIKRKRIDLGVNNVEEEKPWMHRPVTVYILDRAKTW